MNPMVKNHLSMADLSQREKEIMEALLKGLPYKEIANQHFISVNTVKTQIARSYRFLREELDSKCIQLLFLFKSS
jgi:DNA-binding CsgD family transcriptional regulator